MCGKQQLYIVWTLVMILITPQICVVGQKTRARYLILGAGLGGLSAAKNLADNNETDFLILEGSDRIGGRIKEGIIGNTRVETGAQWVHGGLTQSNPIFRLMSSSNVNHYESRYGDVILRDKQGKDVTYTPRWDTFDEALNKLFRLASDLFQVDTYKPDISQRAALSMLGWQPQDAVDYAIEYFDMDFIYGQQPEVTSTRYSFIPSFGNYSENMVLSQHGPFVQIAQVLAGESMETDDPRLRLNTVVTRIVYTDTGVTVYTKSGQIYQGDYVIVTFSLGVLKSGVVEFQPELPEWKKYSIGGSAFVSDYPIYVKFPSSPAFWDEYEWILQATNRRGFFTTWMNYDIVYPGSGLLQTWATDHHVDLIEQMTDDEIKAEVMSVLRSMYGDSIPEAEAILVPRWKSDPLFFGTYGDWSPAFSKESFKALQVPVGRVYFAGDGYHPVWFSYMQGAYFSGIDTTNQIMECRTNSSACEEYVAPYEARGCMYSEADNYDGQALVDDGTCEFPDQYTSSVSHLSSSTVIISLLVLSHL